MKSASIIPICKNNDFRRIYSKGKSFVAPAVVIYVFKNREKTTRIGITTSKKIGNAVKRNRSRRVIREAVRNLLGDFKSGYDYVFVARGKTPYLKSTVIEKVIKKELLGGGFYLKDSAKSTCKQEKQIHTKNP